MVLVTPGLLNSLRGSGKILLRPASVSKTQQQTSVRLQGKDDALPLFLFSSGGPDSHAHWFLHEPAAFSLAKLDPHLWLGWIRLGFMPKKPAPSYDSPCFSGERLEEKRYMNTVDNDDDDGLLV